MKFLSASSSAFFLLAANGLLSSAQAGSEVVDGTVDIALFSNCVGDSGATIEGSCDFEINESNRRSRKLRGGRRKLGGRQDEGFFVSFTNCNLEDSEDNEYKLRDAVLNFEDLKFEETDDVDVIVRTIHGDVIVEDMASGLVVATGKKVVQITLEDDSNANEESVRSIDTVEIEWDRVRRSECASLREFTFGDEQGYIFDPEEDGSRSRK